MDIFLKALEVVLSPDNVRNLGRGLGITLFVAVFSVFLSFIFGTVLAICRAYGNKFVKGFAVAYIEIFRNTPNLLWVLVIRFMVRLPEPFTAPMYSGILAFTLFTTAVMAEIIRGGLNSVGTGQFEGAYAQGFSFLQTLRYIVLPQCYRTIVPAMLSQVITVVKDTSFMAQVAIEEFTYVSRQIMAVGLDNEHKTLQIILLFGVVAATYFIINFTLSLVVRSMRKERTA